MDKSVIKSEIEATRRKLAALQVLAGEDEDETTEPAEKEAGKAEMIKCPDCGSKVLKATGYCLKCKKKIKGGEKKKDEDKDDKKSDKKDSDKKNKEKEAAAKVAESLDEIAGLLESQNDPELTKLAYELDRVSDVLEGKKEASTLESDSDEPYMKQYFHAGARETDSDESYMKEFNTDISTELKDKFQKKQLGKDASSLPYQIVK
jgi:ribosomal protein L37AE/L43A